jgi:hypothetical protein
VLPFGPTQWDRRVSATATESAAEPPVVTEVVVLEIAVEGLVVGIREQVALASVDTGAVWLVSRVDDGERLRGLPLGRDAPGRTSRTAHERA